MFCVAPQNLVQPHNKVMTVPTAMVLCKEMPCEQSTSCLIPFAHLLPGIALKAGCSIKLCLTDEKSKAERN
jgi:hypothetical protein